jgi:hypothetical protein
MRVLPLWNANCAKAQLPNRKDDKMFKSTIKTLATAAFAVGCLTVSAEAGHKKHGGHGGGHAVKAVHGSQHGGAKTGGHGGSVKIARSQAHGHRHGGAISVGIAGGIALGAAHHGGHASYSRSICAPVHRPVYRPVVTTVVYAPAPVCVCD